MPTRLQILVICLVTACLAACTPFAPSKRSRDSVQLPQTFTLAWNGTRELDHWWRSFGSRELNRLMQTALEGNLDIRSAWARLNQARAVAARSGAELFPSIDVQAEGSRTRAFTDHDLRTDSKSLSLDLAAAYELDLWGRIGSAHKAEQMNAQAVAHQVQAARVSVAGEVARAWINAASAREELDILKQQIQTNKQLLQVQILRLENGMGSALDVTQQRQTLAGSRSDLPLLHSERDLALNRLALLLGRADPDSLRIRTERLPSPIPLPKNGVPADLLTSRPDVQAAFWRLKASDWSVAQARAARLPAVSLSARGGLRSEAFILAWGDWLTRLGANLTGPIFDAGLRRAEVQRSLAVVDERVAEYALAVLQAVQEVQDALVQEANQRQRITRLEQELQTARQAREQARLRYIKGQSDFLNFLLQLRSVQSLERSLVRARRDLLAYRIALYRALGAGWQKPLAADHNSGNE